MSRLDELIKKLCPDGVEYKTVGDLANISRGRVMSKDYIAANAGEYPVYSSQTEKEGELGRISSYDFEGEYLTWTTDGANAGSVFYRNGKFSVTNVCGLIDCHEDIILIRYMYHYLSKNAKAHVNSGMGNPKLMSNVMAMVKVAVPPLEVQREIVRILDSFTLLTAELTARKKQYEYYRDTLLSEKKSVEKKTIGEITRVFSASRVHKEDWTTSGVPFFRSSDVISYFNGVENSRGKAFISHELYEKLSAKSGKICKEDVLVTGGGTIGIPYVVPDNEPLYVKDADLICIQKTDCLNNRFLYHYFLSTPFRDYLKSITHNATIAHYTITQVMNTPIPLPSLEVQERLVKVLDNFDTICSDLNIGLPAEIEARQKQYEYYRDKLLNFKKLEQ